MVIVIARHRRQPARVRFRGADRRAGAGADRSTGPVRRPSPTASMTSPSRSMGNPERGARTAETLPPVARRPRSGQIRARISARRPPALQSARAAELIGEQQQILPALALVGQIAQQIRRVVGDDDRQLDGAESAPVDLAALAADAGIGHEDGAHGEAAEQEQRPSAGPRRSGAAGIRHRLRPRPARDCGCPAAGT